MADSLIIKIDGDASGYQKELNKVKDGVGEVNKIAKAVTVATVAATAAVVGMGVKYNAEMEQYKAGFATMLGSAEQADKVISDLKSFAEKTPFEMTDLANASTTLLAFGENSEDLMGDLKMLGDISLGNSEKFKSLALVYGQVQSQGKLMGQDLLQMINSGFNPLLVISEKTGKSMSVLKDEMSKGQITFEMVADAMKSATEEGRQFYNAMEAQSKTLTGQLSTLKDNITALFGEMTSSLSENLSEDILPWAIEQVENLNEAWEEGRLQEFIKGAAVALSAFGAAVVSLNVAMFVNDIYSIAKGVEEFTAATKLGTSAQKLFNLELIKNPYTLAAMALATLVAGMAAYSATHKSAAREAIESIESMAESYEDLKRTTEETEVKELARLKVVSDTIPRLEELSEMTNRTAAEEQEFKSIVDGLNEAMPDLKLAIDSETGALNMQIGTVWKAVDAYKALAKAKAIESLLIEAETNKAKAQKIYDENIDSWNADIKNNPGYHENFFVQALGGWLWSNDINAAQNAQKAIQETKDMMASAESDIDYYSGLLDGLQKESAGLFAEIEDERTVRGGGGTGGTGGSASSTGGSSSGTKEREKQASAYQKAVKKELNAEEWKYRELKALGKLSREEQTESLAELAEKYRQYAEEALTQEQLSSAERYEVRKQWLGKSFELEKEILDEQKNYGIISRKEYWEKLAELRDSHFEEGSEAWLEYSQKIVELQKQEITQTYTEIAEAAESSFEDIASAQEALEEKLKGLGNVIRNVTITGGGLDGTYTMLKDFRQENEILTDYIDALEQLQTKGKDILGGELSEFMQQFAEMSVDDGIKAVDALLSATDTQFNATLTGWRDYRRTSKDFASKFYKSSYESIKNETIRELKELFEDVPETFIQSGELVAEAFGDGFMERIETVFGEIELALSRGLARVMPELSIANASASANRNAGNTYNTSYSLISSAQTIAQQLQEINAAETVKRLRGMD